MKTQFLLSLVCLTCFALAEEVQPLFSVHDKIPGSIQIMTNTQAWVESKLRTAADEVPAATEAAVDEILKTHTFQFRYDGSGETIVTNSFIAPSWTVSPVIFVNTVEAEEVTTGTAFIFPDQPHRNYSVVFDSIPNSAEFAVVQFDSLKDRHRIFATPAFNSWDGSTEYYSLGWKLTAADVPCLISIREPEEGILLVEKTKLDGH